jgi:hypothetical protein
MVHSPFFSIAFPNFYIISKKLSCQPLLFLSKSIEVMPHKSEKFSVISGVVVAGVAGLDVPGHAPPCSTWISGVALRCMGAGRIRSAAKALCFHSNTKATANDNFFFNIFF